MKSWMKKVLQPALDFPLGRRIFYRMELESFLLRRAILKRELSKVPIVQSGVENVDGQDAPYVVLESGVKLYGRFSNDLEKSAYCRWREGINPNIQQEAMQVAIDVILRYLYPHAMPHLVMPYPRARRSSFHPQHRETIWDLPGHSEEQKKSLAEKFVIHPGETFMDIGAYIGFGIVRMAQEIGAEGRIVAVEADPQAFELLRRNVEVNHLTNVMPIPKAIGSQPGRSIFFKTERQANSLIAEVVDARDGIEVEVDTIDNVLQTNGIPSLDRLSITINGAEVEALDGAGQTLSISPQLRISLAGWYARNGQKVCNLVSPRLRERGFQVAIGREGGVFAWK